MAAVRERVRNAELAHDEKRDVVHHHPGPIGVSSCVRRPRAAPFFLRGVNQEPTALHLKPKVIDFEAIRPSSGSVGALEEDKGRREQRGSVLGQSRERPFGGLMPLIATIPQRKKTDGIGECCLHG